MCKVFISLPRQEEKSPTYLLAEKCTRISHSVSVKHKTNETEKTNCHKKPVKQ